MIKYLILLLVLCINVANAEDSAKHLSNVPVINAQKVNGLHGLVGLGVVHKPEYVGGDDYEIKAIPIVNVNYRDIVYLKFNKLGGWFLKTDNGFKFGGLVTMQQGFDAKEVKVNRPASDRENSILAGLNATYQMNMLNVEIGALKDVSDESEGQKYYANLGYNLFYTPEFTVSMNVGIERLDDKMAGYYYGNAEGVTNTTLGLTTTYQFSEQWLFIGSVSATNLGDNATKGHNTWMQENSYAQVLLGVAYAF